MRDSSVTEDVREISLHFIKEVYFGGLCRNNCVFEKTPKHVFKQLINLRLTIN